MQPPKTLPHYLLEAYERYQADRAAAAPMLQHAGTKTNRAQRLLRWLMPNGGTLILIALLIMTQQVWAFPAAISAPGPSATTINYQGKLSNTSGAALNGTYGMTFALYDAAAGGSLIWGPESHTAVQVSNGLMSVGLGSQTAGGIPTTVWNGDRYLQITVNGEALSPRELIRGVPVAGMALTVPDASITKTKLASGAVTSENTTLKSGQVFLTSSFVPNNTPQTPPGLSFTVNVSTPQVLLVYATMDAEAGPNTWTTVGNIYVDGQSKYPPLTVGKPGQTDRASVAGVVRIPLAPGSHTIELKVWREGSEGGFLHAQNTTMAYFLFSQ